MGERESEQPTALNQDTIEQEIKQQSPETGEVLDNLEREKLGQDMLQDMLEERKRSPQRETRKNFIKRHGSPTKREKTHSRRGIIRSKEKAKPKSSQYEQLQRELSDFGISDLSQWREATEEKATEVESETRWIEVTRFKNLLSYLGYEQIFSDQEKIEKFKTIQDSIERLRFLLDMSVIEAIQALSEGAYTEGAKKYLARRLDFYQKLIQGEAVRRYYKTQYDPNQNKYVRVVKEQPVQAQDLTPEAVRQGLFRDILFASMIGTPEMAIYQIAIKKCEQRGLSTKHMVQLRGCDSGINYGVGGDIGYGYPFLRKLYNEARQFIKQRMTEKGEQEDERNLEHRAVLLASEWLTEAMNYNDPNRSTESPYVSKVEEAVAWTRLGDKRIKAQLRGMRRKIQGINLRNIERFIGKSGPNRYADERRRLQGKIKILKRGSEQARLDLLERENHFMLERQNNWFMHEKERLEKKFEKDKTRIEQSDLPEEERKLQIANLQSRFEKEIAELESQHQERLEYFKHRSLDQLLFDLQEHQKVVEEKYERSKSLVEKALDLHFRINHISGDNSYANKPLAEIIDWINYAPFGTIKRAHRMMCLGMSDEQIVKYALADIIAGIRGATREDIKLINHMVQEVIVGNLEVKKKLKAMVKVGNILSRFGYEVSFREVEEIAQKDFSGLGAALREYSLDEVKAFMDQGLSLHSVVAVRQITREKGYNLDNATIAEIASCDITGLEEAIDTFGLASTQELLKQEMFSPRAILPRAVKIYNNAKAYGYQLSLNQVATIANGVEDVNDFILALQHLPIEEVEQLYNAKQRYISYETVRSALAEHNQDSSFSNTLEWTQRLARLNEWGYLSEALQVFSLEEVKQLLDKDVAISVALELRETLAEVGFENSPTDIARWSKIARGLRPGDTIKRAAEKFGRDNLRKMLEKEVPLQNALDVKDVIERRGLHQFDTLEVIMNIAKYNKNIDLIFKTLEAGFTAEEIVQYPFLVSHLVSRK
jgi:hypothetical protein